MPKTKEILEQVMQDGVVAAALQIGLDDADIVNLVNEKAVAYAAQRSAELVGKRVLDDGTIVDNPNASWRIDESTRDYLRADVEQAMQEGWSAQRLASEIKDNYAFSDARSLMIARTEIAKADVQGNLQIYKDSGLVEGKQSLLGSEHDIDDECDDNAAEGVIPLDEAFSSGDDGPPYHPGCFLSGTVVAAFGVTAHWCRWFEGEIVRVFIGDKQLAMTPNHPVLTARGWVAAENLKIGDDLFECTNPAIAVNSLNPDDYHVPTCIEQIADTLLMAGGVATAGMPTTAVDFHGDGIVGGQVDVVWAASALRNHPELHSFEDVENLPLAAGHDVVPIFSRQRTANGTLFQFFNRSLATARRIMRSLRIFGDLLPSERGVPQLHIVASGTDRHTESIERVAERRAMASDVFGETDTALTIEIPSIKFGDIFIGETAHRLLCLLGSTKLSKSSLDKASFNNLVGDAKISSNALDGSVASLIRSIKVTDISNIYFAGHVYNLSTESQWYFAEGIISHNCVCDVVPVIIHEGDEE